MSKVIEEYLEKKLGSKVKTTNTPSEIHICCPVCGETRYRMYINVDSRLVYCHNCQFSGTIIKLIQQIEGISYYDAISRYKDFSVIKSPQQLHDYLFIREIRTPAVAKRPIALPDEYQPLSSCENVTARKAIKYLHKRGITNRQIEQYKIGVCSLGEYRDRIILPIYYGNDLKFWVARAIGTAPLKEKSPHTEEYQFSKSEVLFNVDLAVRKYHFIILSEGIFDALSWGEAGVALLGKSLYDAQLDTLLGYKNELTEGIYLALDADATESMIKIAKRLSAYFPVYLIRIPYEFDDPNNFLVKRGRGELLKLVDKAEIYGDTSSIRQRLENLR